MLPRTISALRALYTRREISPSEALAESLAVIERKEPVVKAWTQLHADEAREHARKLDHTMSRVAELPPLFGVPYGAKDIFHAAGWPTEAGSKVIAGEVSQEDATVVRLLREQQAILLGKTATTEFANWGGPPPTTNAWNPEHTPAGSSSGSAAAVASGMVPFALGTQTSGSLSRPAAFNGVTVLKPTYGRISKHGVIPASIALDHIGAFTRDIADTVLFFNAVAGPDPLDPATLPTPPVTLQLRASSPKTIGVLDTQHFRNADTAVLAHYEAALKTFVEMGYEVVEVATPAGFEDSIAAHAVVMQAEVAHYHSRYFGERAALYSDYLREYIREGLAIPAERYIEAQAVRLHYRRAFAGAFDKADILATPAAPTTAPHGLHATGSPAFNQPFSNLGVPTLAMPNGFADNGLPTGLQLIAPMCEEQRLIDAGYHFQSATDWHLRVPE